MWSSRYTARTFDLSHFNLFHQVIFLSTEIKYSFRRVRYQCRFVSNCKQWTMRGKQCGFYIFVYFTSSYMKWTSGITYIWYIYHIWIGNIICEVPNHDANNTTLNHCDWNPMDTLLWNLNKNVKLVFTKTSSENIVCKMPAILFRYQCVNL